MAAAKGDLLVIDDDAGMRAFIASVLEPEGYKVREAASGEEGVALALGDDHFDAVITDVHMGELSGLEVCRQLRERRAHLPVLVLTAFGSMDLAIEALRAGAVDFLQKPVDVDLLLIAVEQAVETGRLKEEVRRLRAQVEAAQSPEAGSILGTSPEVQRLKALVSRVARTPSTVLIVGESGTGKEVVAKTLHELSPRAGKPFVALNCTAFPEALLESQLFGHKKGAFTDARTDQKGLFLEADGGTLFLDEIGDMPVSLQPKLLRVLQERSVRPLGGERDLPFDVRVIAATHRDMEHLVEQGGFREDLYYRLNVVQLDIPPLRVRGNDVLELAQHFLKRHAAALGVDVVGISPEAARALLTYSWPGNVRELSNCIERAVALAEHDQLLLDDLPDRVKSTKGKKAADIDAAEPELLRLEEVERRHILKVFELCGKNRVQTAKVLGIDRKTLYRKLSAWGFSEKEDAP